MNEEKTLPCKCSRCGKTLLEVSKDFTGTIKKICPKCRTENTITNKK